MMLSKEFKMSQPNYSNGLCDSCQAPLQEVSRVPSGGGFYCSDDCRRYFEEGCWLGILSDEVPVKSHHKQQKEASKQIKASTTKILRQSRDWAKSKTGDSSTQRACEQALLKSIKEYEDLLMGLGKV
jgi:hypothetical protein